VCERERVCMSVCMCGSSWIFLVDEVIAPLMSALTRCVIVWERERESVCVCLVECVCACVPVHLCAWVCMYVCVCVCVCVCVYV